MLEIRNLSKTYKLKNEENVIFRNINYLFPLGSKVSILGESGCGKSTLLNILGGIDPGFDGDIILGGYCITDYDKYRRESVSFIFQELNLISHYNLINNVTIGMTNDVCDKENRAIELLEKVGLGEHTLKKPNQLSGGEKQRVAIARALARDTDILLCDEPTGNLDAATKEVIMQLIFSVFSDKTIIFVTHDESLAKRYSDIILRVDNETISEIKTDKLEEKYNALSEINRKQTNKVFRGRRIRNMTSNLRELFNATYLIITISAVFLFGIGVVKGVEKEIDAVLSDKYNVDSVWVGSKGFTLDGIEKNILDYNEKYEHKIKGFTTGLLIDTSFSNIPGENSNFINSLSEGIENNIASDIVFGKYPENDNEILYSRGATRKKIFDYHIRYISDDKDIEKLFDWINSMTDEELYDEITSYKISYKNFSPYNENKYYDENLIIVGIIDDKSYYPESTMSEDHINTLATYRININANSNLSINIADTEKHMIVNNNIYMLENELEEYLLDVYLGNNDYKFTYFNIYIEEEDLDLRETVFDNFMLFKPIFLGQDYVINERKLYYSDIHGYKIALIGACCILAAFSIVSVVNGIKNNINKHLKNIGIYRSLGYASEDIQFMFAIEGALISGYVIVSSVIIWGVINFFMNEKLVNALDPSHIISQNKIVYLDIWSLIGVGVIITLIIMISINRQLKRSDIANLIKQI